MLLAHNPASFNKVALKLIFDNSVFLLSLSEIQNNNRSHLLDIPWHKLQNIAIWIMSALLRRSNF